MIYIRDVSDVRPVLITMPRSIVHSWLTDCDLFLNSPALYVRKKSAGSDIRRIIMEACTPSEVFMLSLLVIKDCALVRSCVEKDTQTMQIAIPMRASALPLLNTAPVRVAVSLGIRSPTSETAAAAATIMMMSLNETHLFM